MKMPKIVELVELAKMITMYLLAFWDGEAFGRAQKCNIGVFGILVWGAAGAVGRMIT